MRSIVLYTFRDEPRHNAMVNAFLDEGGWYLFGGVWFEIHTMAPIAANKWQWLLVPARLVGAA